MPKFMFLLRDQLDLVHSLLNYPLYFQKSIMNTFQEDYKDLFRELQAITGRCQGRKVNDMIKRVKRVEIHAQLMSRVTGSRLRFSKSDAGMKKMLKEDRVERIFHDFRLQKRLTVSDLPDLNVWLAKARETTMDAWKKEDSSLMKILRKFIVEEIPK